MRIVFMGTPDFSVPTLERLIASEHEVLAVYTQQDKPARRGRITISSPIKLVAQNYGLTLFQPSTFKTYSEVKRLESLRPDVIVVVAFGQILPRRLLDIPQYGCLNVHPSLLPRYRGASPIASAILEGEKKTGVTVMLLDAGIDTGPILTQMRISINNDDTTESLGTRLAEVGAELLEETLPAWFAHHIQIRQQNEEEATYTVPITKEDGKIDWCLSAVELWRKIRAFYPWPGCFTRWQGKILKVLDAVPLANQEGVEPGMVVSLTAGRGAPVGVGTGEGILGLCRIQMEGKKAMSINDFIHGQRLFVGQKLA